MPKISTNINKKLIIYYDLVNAYDYAIRTIFICDS